MLAPALAALAAYKQFILYHAAPSPTRPGRTEKFPCSALTGQVIDAHDPAYWVTAEVAYSIAPLFGPEYGVGFVLSDADPFFCLDVDDCLTSSGWSKQALELCTQFAGAAIEVSQSNKGLHIWGKGEMPPHGCKNTALGLELYNSRRFIALGAPNATGNASTDCTAALARIVPQYFPPSVSPTTPIEWTNGPCADWRGPADDDELIRRMLASTPSAASAFGGRATVADLWEGNVEALARSYPSTSQGQPYGQSEADAGLCQHLAFWTGRDCERMARLMRRSALAREKYEREDYVQRTVLKACSISTTVYRERQSDIPGLPSSDSDDTPGPAAQPLTHTGRLTGGNVFVTPEQQIELWKGYTYVTDANVILTATGQQLGPEQFKNRYGGNVFIISNDNGKTTNNAWEAFTQSQATRMPKVDHSAFRPDLPPEALWERDGESFVNTYRRLNIRRIEGDAAPFLNHVKRVLPNKRDRDILLAYMAAVVQYPGVKFQWAPLIQGTPGNGKTLFSTCVSEAVGERYTHFPKAAQIAEKFNGWLVGKIFIGVEDVYYPEGRTEIVETLKPMITGRRQPIREMGRTERTMDVCANFIVNSNHKDAIRKTADDRRWCVMFCAQQSKEDKIRDGLTDMYFKSLYGWLQKDGYAIVAEFLRTYQIPEEFGLDCLRGDAPDTSSTEEAIAVSLGRVEQEVMEAIQSGQQGFAGGWVSSLALDAMLKSQRMDLAMPRSKRRGMMVALGFEHHPAFRDGRCTAVLPGTTTRPILYIKKDHWAAGLMSGSEVMKAYLAAQMPGAVMSVVGGEGVGT